jgi:hypothetical protein
MRKRDEWIIRIKHVEQEYNIATLAISLLAERIRNDPTLLPEGIQQKDIERTAEGFVTTYLVRMFAVFEAGLRRYWHEGLKRDTHPPMRDLLDGITSTRSIDHPFLEAAHRVREFRNSLVHDQDDEPEETFTIEQSRRHLTRYFSYLPPHW